MRRLLALLIAAALPQGAVAQEGTVLYDRVVRHEFEIPDFLEEMKDRIPMQTATEMVLSFSEGESWMREVEGEQAEAPVSDRVEHLAMRLKMGSASRSDRETYLETYVDLGGGTFAETREFMGRVFRITGERPVYRWKLSGERSAFLGFAVQKATAVFDTTAVEAWFAPEIPVSAGPGLFGGLPGLILVLTVDGDRTVFSATDVRLEPPKAIAAPSGGVEVTHDAYEEIVATKLREVAASRRGAGRDRRR